MRKVVAVIIVLTAGFSPLYVVSAFRRTVTAVSNSGFGAYEASLTPMGRGFAAAWYDTRHGHTAVYARLLDARGAPAGPERRLTTGTADAYEPDIASAGALVIVSWYERNADQTYRAMVGAWTKDGVEKWRRQLSTGSGKNPLVRARGADIFCTWLEMIDGDAPVVRAQWLDVEGRPRGTARTIAPIGLTTWHVNATLGDDGSAWVAFDARAGTRSDELFLARVDHQTHTVARITADDGKASKYPDIALRGGDAALTWYDERDGNDEVYLLVAPLASLRGEVDARASRITRTPGESIGAYVAWNGPRVGLTWCDNSIGGQHEVFFETFDRRGRSISPSQRLTDTPAQSMIPAIRPARRGFALVWNEFTPAAGGGHDPRGRSEIVFALVR